MKKGFFFPFIVAVLFFSSMLVILLINASYQYLSSVHHYRKIIFCHYLSKSILQMYHDKKYKEPIKSWLTFNDKKMYYVTILDNKVCLMDNEEPKGKIIYSYKEEEF